MGMLTPSPQMMHSRLRRAGIESRNPRAPSGMAARTKAWSRSLFKRIEMIVPHCDNTPSARSEGRCVIRPSDTPYLRPSLAIRSSTERTALSFDTRSDGMYRCASSQTSNIGRCGSLRDQIA